MGSTIRKGMNYRCAPYGGEGGWINEEMFIKHPGMPYAVFRLCLAAPGLRKVRQQHLPGDCHGRGDTPIIGARRWGHWRTGKAGAWGWA